MGDAEPMPLTGGPDDHNGSVRAAAGWPGRRWFDRRRVRVAVGVLWLVDAALQAEPAKFNRDYPLHDLAQSVMGAPSWVNRSVFAGIDPFVAHWPWWDLAAVLLQVAIGAALLRDRVVRPALVASFLWTLAVWWLGEAFGTLTTGLSLLASGAPGSVLLYAVIGALAWPRGETSDVHRRWWSAAWLLVWVGTVVVQLRTSYPQSQVLTAGLHDLSAGQPRPLRDTATWMERVVAHHSAAIVIVLIALQVAIGVGAIAESHHPRLWLGLGIALSLFFWVVFQQLGGIFTSAATDVNTAPLVVLLALAAWPRRPQLARVVQWDASTAASA